MPLTVLEAVERANQRGGRMLSVLDLVDAGTLGPGLCAWLLSRIREGSSWLVGARPGGAGKTTIMAALLAMLPEGTRVRVAGDPGWREAEAGECAVAYETGSGSWDGYVWGAALREFAALAGRGCRIVSNIHADTLEEARGQVTAQNGVPEADFDAFSLFLPIRFRAGTRRAPFVPSVWRRAEGGWEEVREPQLDAAEEGIRAWLESALARQARTVEDVRASWLAAP